MLIGHLKMKLKKMQAAGKIDINIHLFDIIIFLIDICADLSDNIDLVLPRMPAAVDCQTFKILTRQIPARKEGHEPKRRKKNVRTS